MLAPLRSKLPIQTGTASAPELDNVDFFACLAGDLKHYGTHAGQTKSGCNMVFIPRATRSNNETDLVQMQLEKTGTVKTISQRGDLKVLVVIEIHQDNPDQPARLIISPINQSLERQITESIQMAVSAIPITLQQTGRSPNEVNWVMSMEEYRLSGLCVGDTLTLTLLRIE